MKNLVINPRVHALTTRTIKYNFYRWITYYHNAPTFCVRIDSLLSMWFRINVAFDDDLIVATLTQLNTQHVFGNTLIVFFATKQQKQHNLSNGRKQHSSAEVIYYIPIHAFCSRPLRWIPAFYQRCSPQHVRSCGLVLRVCTILALCNPHDALLCFCSPLFSDQLLYIRIWIRDEPVKNESYVLSFQGSECPFWTKIITNS